MSLTPTNSLSIPRPRDWAAVLVIIVIICVSAAQIEGVLTNLIALSAVLVSGTAVRAASARWPHTDS
ncbi:hypothetical protein ACIBAG_08200 [Streptomyces sp. NPDC051243]|uniref:hypothetical protein n=1 Tax=Streptomyces sp. NPDC051243 TaxID=3365646 RepID=UPI0037BCF78D